MGEVVKFFAPERTEPGAKAASVIEAVVQNDYQYPFKRGDLVMVDTAQTDLAEGHLAVLDDYYAPAQLLTNGKSVCFYEVEPKNAGWFMVRRRSGYPWDMYHDKDGPRLPKTVVGRVVLHVRFHPGWKECELYQRQKRR